MKRLLPAIAIGLTLTVGESAYLYAQAQTKPTAHVARYDTPTRALQAYVSLMNEGKMPAAYSLYADIKKNISLKEWESSGDPFKGTNAVIKLAHVDQKDEVADVYTVFQENKPHSHVKQNVTYLLSLIQQRGTWKMVYKQSDFGAQKNKVFQGLNHKEQTFALQQLKSHHA